MTKLHKQMFRVEHYNYPFSPDVSYETWRDEAACSGMDPAMFELKDGDRSEADFEFYEASTLICKRNCPVKSECFFSATDDDLNHTIRGGNLPRQLSRFKRGRPKGGGRSHNFESGRCKYDMHDISNPGDLTELGNCVGCDGERLRLNLKSDHCRNGHEYSEENTRLSYGGDGYFKRDCRHCVRINSRRSKKKRRTVLS